MAWPRFRSTLAALAALGIACSSVTPACVDVPLTNAARAALEVESKQAGFAPVLPCGTGRGFAVTSIVSDALPGTPPGHRLSFIVERNGERSYVLSETRTSVTSTQIPQGTRRLRVTSGATVAEGFAGPSGGGGEMAYLRWRSNGVTYELDATLGRGLDEGDVRQIAAALMPRAAGATR